MCVLFKKKTNKALTTKTWDSADSDSDPVLSVELQFLGQ